MKSDTMTLAILYQVGRDRPWSPILHFNIPRQQPAMIPNAALITDFITRETGNHCPFLHCPIVPPGPRRDLRSWLTSRKRRRSVRPAAHLQDIARWPRASDSGGAHVVRHGHGRSAGARSEEHTSELQSHLNL